MKKNQIWSVIGVLILVVPMLFGLLPEKTEAAGAVYYVDAGGGNDNNSGTSPDQAWATLDKLEKTTFEPGDTIRLHEESVFDDTLVLDGKRNGEGADGAPIILESYGDTGGKATINGNGEGYVDQMEKRDIYSAVTLYNASHWTIRNLAITNIGPGEDTNKMSKTDRVGLYVLAKNNGLTQDIHVDNLDVSDVNGSWNAKDIGNGGIFFTVSGTPTGEVTRFHNISVTNCQVENVTRTGISVGATVYGDIITPETEATTIEESAIQQYGHTEVLIENNYVKQSGGDAIVPQFCYKPLIQYNVSDTASFSHSKWDLTSKENGTWQVNAGIWPWLCYFPNFQYNEAFNTVDNYDGEAFDCDSGTGTIYQYNYSHDNEGGFMLICSPKNFDSLIRYNISQNDRKHLFLVSNSLNPEYNDPRYPGITEEETANVYNNTFYTGAGLDVTVMSQEEPGYVRMKNNLFYNEGTNTTPYWQPAHYGEEHPATVKYDHNLYYGYTNLPNNEENPIVVKNPSVELTGEYNVISLPGEPQHERGATEDEAVEEEVMVAPGTGGTGLDSVSGYQLLPTSPAINAGTTLADNGGQDYFGNSLADGQTDIGAHEYTGEVPPPSSSTEESSSSTKPSTSSTEESSSTTESSSSSMEESSSTTESSSSSTEESSSSTESSSSSTEESSSTTESSSSSTEESSSSAEPSTSSTEESSSSTEPSTSSTEESSSSTESSSSSTEESSSTTESSSSSTEESSSTTESSSSSTEESSSSTKPSSSSTEESNSSTKPSTSSTKESSGSTGSTSGSTEEESTEETKSSSTNEESSSKDSSEDSKEGDGKKKPTDNSEVNIAGGTPKTPNGGGGNNANVSARNQTINGATESTKKELPKTGNTINYLLIWCGIALIIGSITLIKKTTIACK
ncbi:LPXTG cell wall anchor domain-containing protein [Enterococcus raffinosus]|uniref:LPXTG cell wall anchor domain-containing protein n=1 Tax=Enterococcus raffinosus TaxID=71452 RepID=UPI001C43A75D|nr:LPXTG cell wall anchor domain-containing protein [Enterococcus raffinosus]MDT2572722.1 LPXTG cell wall anchor domain-containing protein [Enterococcus raffinosus]QXJ59585.1 LPXTG cell wall anchor domain-containing protein [Enterococcus raffinosus]